jgi:hypothetical protein
MARDLAPIRVGKGQLHEVAGADHAHERRDDCLERPEAVPLQPQDQERRDPRHDRGGEERPAEQEMEAEGRAEELGEVGRHRDRLGLDPQPDRRASREPLAADLGQVAAGGDPELRRERLDQHRHQVRGEDHPAERVAELRAARDVRREVARVDVRDARDEGRPEERQDPPAPRVASQRILGRPHIAGGDRI